MLPLSPRVLVAEGLGTALLVAVVVGSGIMAERLAGDQAAIALLANAIATALGLAVLVLVFGPLCNAHFNPVVSIALAVRAGRTIEGGARAIVQILAAPLGVLAAHAMFDVPFAWSEHARTGTGQWLGEAIATFGLIGVVTVVPRHRPEATPWAVGAYIGSAYWFTSSTSFANPAVTLARTLTDTFTGIQPEDALPFIVAQVVGAAAGAIVFVWLLNEDPKR